MKLREYFSLIQTNLSGKRIKEKIIVFESDDWGTIRISSVKNQKKLIDLGIDFSEDQHTLYDGLETNEDMQKLADLLNSFEDFKGNKACFTLNAVMANPQFEQIRRDDYQNYYYEEFWETYNNYSDSDRVLDIIKDGINSKLFLAQFHSREHVNVELWLELLRNKNVDFLKAFDFGIFALGKKYTMGFGKHIAATYDTFNKQYVEKSFDEGLKIFDRSFHYLPISYIPNNYIWNIEWNTLLSSFGISHIQGMKYILQPKYSPKEKRKKVRLYSGKLTKYNQTYGVRNCTFEPLERNYDFGKVLREIELAFLFKQPAVLSTHRVNYTSRISYDTRDKSLKELQSLLKKIKINWPDVIFLNTAELTSYLR